MNANDPSAKPPAAEPAPPPPDGSEDSLAKQKKPRAPRKIAAAAVVPVVPVVPVVKAPSAAELFAPGAKPATERIKARTRATATRAADSQDLKDGEESAAPENARPSESEAAAKPTPIATTEAGAAGAGGSAVAAAPARRARRPAVSAAARADPEAAGEPKAASGQEASPPQVLEPLSQAPSHTQAESATKDTADSSNPVNPEEAQVGEGRSGKRGRNRRRGRRGGDRAKDTEGAQDQPRTHAAPDVAALAPAAGELFAMVLSGEYDSQPAGPDASDAGQDAPGDWADQEATAQLDLQRAATDASSAADPEVVAMNPDAAAASGDAEQAPQDAVSGDAGLAAGPGKRVLAPEPDAPKLQKVLAQSGVGSRRDLEQMIADGRVTVNGAVAHTGQRISHGDRIQLDGKPVRYRVAPPPARVLAYHKPTGEVVTHDDPQQRPTVFRRLPRLQQGKWQSVGRLDINTEGLLLFTNSGELANQLMHPRFGVEREYAVRSLGLLSKESQARLLDGVEMDGQRASFKSIEDGGGEGVNHWYRVVITEGRNREVRRLFEAVGHAVSRLIRIRYGSVVLPRGLKRGVWVDLQDDDLRQLRRLASGPGAAGPGGGRQVAADAGPSADGTGRNADKKGRKRRGRRGGRDGEDLPVQALPGSESGVPAESAAQPQERGPRPPRAERGPRVERAERSERGARPERAPRPQRGQRGQGRPGGEGADRVERGEGGAIPNPLQQTFDKRAMQQARKGQREYGDDGPIPNPLLQTYDKRAVQNERRSGRELSDDSPIPNPMLQTYDKRFAQGGRGQDADEVADPDHIPDPMQTSVGYIGADALRRKGGGGGGRGGRSGRRGGSGTSGMGVSQGGQRGPGGGHRGGSSGGPSSGPGGGSGNNKKRRGPRGGKGR